MTRDDDGIVDILGPYHVTPPGLVRAAIKLINPSQKYYAWCMPSGRPMARLTSSSTIERFSRARPDQGRKLRRRIGRQRKMPKKLFQKGDPKPENSGRKPSRGRPKG